MNPKRLRKAIASLAAGVIGVLALFGVDASATVEAIAGAILAATPLLVYLLPNEG